VNLIAKAQQEAEFVEGFMRRRFGDPVPPIPHGWNDPRATVHNDGMASPGISITFDGKVLEDYTLTIPEPESTLLGVLSSLLPGKDLTAAASVSLDANGNIEGTILGKTITLDMPADIERLATGYEAVTGTKPEIGVSLTL